jgi:preprotein translocase subunit SecG
MLSFLRDPNLAELPAEKKNATVQKPGQESAGETKEQEYLTVATKGRDVRKSTILLGILFIIGLACLGFMIKKSSPKTASAEIVNTEEMQIEAAIARITGIKSEMFSRMDEIVSKFYEFSDVLQVKVSELVKNPFQLEMFLTNLKAESNAEDSLEIDVEMILQEQITRKAMDMKLVSIMQSNQGVCCMINNKILYEGDLIEDFKVKQIGYNHVKLELESVEVTLKLSD